MSSRATILPILAAVVAAGAASAQSDRVADTAVVTRVSEQSITRKALEDHLLRYYGRLGLEQLIDRAVLKQELTRYKLQVTDAEVDQRTADLKKRGGDALQDAMKADGISEPVWRERVRYELIAEKVLDKKWPVKDADLERISVRYARLQNERQARALIREARNATGRTVETLFLQQSEDKEHGGLVQPDPFMRVQNPVFFNIVAPLNLRPGQIHPQPIESNGFYLVIRLEQRLPASTLTSGARQDAVRRIRAVRAVGLIPASRKRYKIVTKVPVSTLVQDGQLPDNTEVAHVAPLGAGASEAAGTGITRKDLRIHLLENGATPALNQLVERSRLSQEAARLKVAVTDADVSARVEEVQKLSGKTVFQLGLDREGITEADWRERVRYTLMAEKIQRARTPVAPAELERLVVRYIRVGSREEAQRALLALQQGAAFEVVQRQMSLDRMGDGFIQPKMFMRADNPTLWDKIPAGAAAGQVIGQPVQLGESWVLLRVEGRFGAETLTAKERDAAIRKINASRLDATLEELRSDYPAQQAIPLQTLISAARA